MSRTTSILKTDPETVKHLLKNFEFKSFRINRLACTLDHETLQKYFNDTKIFVRQLPWYSDAFLFNAEDTEKVQSSTLAQNGEIFIQSPSSYLPVFALQPKVSDSILDMCAAPGGKAAHIASLISNSSNLTLNEPKGPRIKKLRDVVTLQHMKDAHILQANGQHLPSLLTEKFDKVLVDAECSTEGSINFRSKNPLAGWSLDYIRGVSILQTQLITAAYDLLKPGGTLVYSTCTMAPEENEGVVNALLERRKEATMLPLSFSSEKNIRKIRSWNSMNYPDNIAQSVLRVYPSEHMEAFFVAKIRKPGVQTEDHIPSIESVIKSFVS